MPSTYRTAPGKTRREIALQNIVYWLEAIDAGANLNAARYILKDDLLSMKQLLSDMARLKEPGPV